MSITIERRRLAQTVVPFVGTFVVLAAVWAYTAHPTSTYVLTLPDMLKAFGNTWFCAHFSDDLIPSLEHLIGGFLIALVLGIVWEHYLDLRVRFAS